MQAENTRRCGPLRTRAARGQGEGKPGMAVLRWRDDPWGDPHRVHPKDSLSPNVVAAASQRGPLGTVGRSPPVRPVRSSGGVNPPSEAAGRLPRLPPTPRCHRRNVDAPREAQRRARLPPRRGLARRRRALGKQPCTNGWPTGAWRRRAGDRRRRASRLLQPPGGAARQREGRSGGWRTPHVAARGVERGAGGVPQQEKCRRWPAPPVRFPP